ncbi:MAG: phospholipase D family protein [Burkholderiaceae bacterium]|jgi:phosphatidylserine/phosphatidylglycerophosphate/cardiolipin synthase-like enzyme|nr:phospholipase D family protein [Burkholderiaceae bacterium]
MKPLICLALMTSVLTVAARAQTCWPEAGFSPEGSAARLVDQAIDSARKSIRLAGYSFTSPDIVRRLIKAKRRGVNVSVVVDARNNLEEDQSGKGRVALNLLSGAEIPVRVIDIYSLHHDKYIVIDDDTVETGSFNYTVSAARYNSENVIVLWHCQNIAQAYLNHWNSRWKQGRDWQIEY